MKKKKHIDPYEHVSFIYYHLMDFVDYKWWAKYIYSITANQINKSPSVLELGAGNCKMAAHLSKNYKNYIASDISFNMLSGSNVKIQKVCCDMTALPFNKKFDLIFSAFDSINYLTSKTKLKSLFHEVYTHLSEDGVFTFDAALINNSIKLQKTAESSGNINGIKYYQTSKFYPFSRIHKNTFRIYHPEKVITETHKQKIYEFETYFELAEKCNLYVADCFKAFTYQKAKPASDRVQFIMKRKP
ncbi:MAG: class I SAM-dependent methyltransferase [Ignavibacteriaceae bacterium]|nr:class I SAM-dependent methyltransferase [Ignavibacteriaceae bacterium]